MSASENFVDQSNNKNISSMETGGVKFVKDCETIDVPPTTKLIGLTKEQLEQYRNDPFWKPVRYGLFVLFWLVWLGMFVGAILIVVLSPKCSSTNSTGSTTMISYTIFVPSFLDTDGDGVGDLNGIKKKLKDLRKIGITAIWPTPLLKINKDNFLPAEVVDLMSFDKRFVSKEDENAIEDLKELIVETHNAGLKFIADIPLTVFNDRNKTWIKNIPKAILTSSVGLKGGNAVALDLNNEEVKLKLAESAAQFLRLGVDVLHLADYGLFRNSAKSNTKQIESLIEKIHERIINDTLITRKKPIIFTEENLSSLEINSNFTETYQILDLSFGNGDFLKRLEKNIQRGLNNQNPKNKTIWQLSSVDSPRIDEQFSSNKKFKKSKITTLLTLIQLFLPSSVNIYYGQELGLISHTTNIKGTGTLNQTPMRWDTSKNYGFSSVDGQLFFPIFEDPENPVMDFESQYKNSKSPLRIFKRMSELRTQILSANNEIKLFKDNNLRVYAAESDQTNLYVLIVNLPDDNGVEESNFFKLTPEITQGHDVSKGEVKISFDSTYQTNEIVDLSTDDGIQIKPYQGLLLRLF